MRALIQIRSFAKRSHFVSQQAAAMNDSRPIRRRLSRCTLRQTWVTLRPEIWTQLRLALPIMLSNCCQFLLLTVSTMISGHAGHMAKVDLDGVTLANSMINAFGFSMAAGLATACDTLFSQGLGSSRPGRTGVFLVRSLLILNMVALLLTAIHENFLPILVYVMNQKPEVAQVAATFLKDFRFGIVFYFNFIMMARFMQAQGLCYPPLIAAISGNVLNTGTQVMLLYLHAHTPRTTAICQASATALMALIELVYLAGVYENRSGAWHGLSKQSLHHWGSFLWLAVCGLFHNSLEVIYWEIGTILAGMMDITVLGVQAVLYLSETVLFTTQLGIAIVVNHRLGRALGSGEDVMERVKVIIKSGFCITGTLALVLFIILNSLRDVLAVPFTDDPEIRAHVARALPVVACCIAIDGFECLLAGALRGCGKQKVGAFIVGTSFYLIGLPISILLAFYADMQVIGLWIGTMVGVIVTTVRYAWLLWRTDWLQESERAILRVQTANRAYMDSSDDESAVDREMSFPSERQPLLQNGRGRRRTPTPQTISRRLLVVRLIPLVLCLAAVIGGHFLSDWSEKQMNVTLELRGPPPFLRS